MCNKAFAFQAASLQECKWDCQKLVGNSQKSSLQQIQKSIYLLFEEQQVQVIHRKAFPWVEHQLSEETKVWLKEYLNNAKWESFWHWKMQ